MLVQGGQKSELNWNKNIQCWMRNMLLTHWNCQWPGKVYKNGNAVLNGKFFWKKIVVCECKSDLIGKPQHCRKLSIDGVSQSARMLNDWIPTSQGWKSSNVIITSLLLADIFSAIPRLDFCLFVIIMLLFVCPSSERTTTLQCRLALRVD